MGGTVLHSLDTFTVKREFKTELDFCFWPRGTDRDQIYFWPQTTGEQNTKPQEKYTKQQFQDADMRK